MLYDKICLSLPTYKRANGKLRDYIDTALNMCSDKSKICFSFVVNQNDKETQEFIKKRFEKVESEYEILIENLPEPHLAKFWNMFYEKTKFQEYSTLVSMTGDDMQFRTEGWDSLVLKWVNYLGGIGLFYGDDCKNSHEKLSVFFFTSRKYIDALKPLPFMCEMFPCDDMDVVHYNTALTLNRLFYIKDLKIFHNHATLDRVHDETWTRLRKTFITVEKNRSLEQQYVDECVKNIRANLKEEFEPEIDVMITTCGRVELFEKTVTSLNQSIDKPKSIHVFDDQSDNVVKIEDTAMQIKDVDILFCKGDKKLGVNMKTPDCLKYMFEKHGSKAVLIIDSDTIFNKFWWPRAIALYNQLKDNENFACFSLYNANNVPGNKTTEEIPDVVQRDCVGAFGMLVTSEFWHDFILPLEEVHYLGWDNKCGDLATKAGKKVYASSPSFLQHAGVYDGSHIGEIQKPSMADDFLMNDDIQLKMFDVFPEINAYPISLMNPPERGILFCCLGRYGDILMDSWFANQLIDKGFIVFWLVTKYYSELVGCICPKAKKLLDESVDMKTRWAHTTTAIMKKQYPNFKYYVNAQPGSPEHHDFIIQSKMSTIDYIADIIEGATKEQLDRDYAKYARLWVENKYVDMYNIDLTKPLCIIAPDAISTMPVITDNLILELIDKYQKDYEVKVLVESLPDNFNRALKRNYLWNITFIDCIFLLKKASLFIGNDSGLAWASMYNPRADKIIYHHKDRIEKFHNYFNRIDPKAKDVII